MGKKIVKKKKVIVYTGIILVGVIILGIIFIPKKKASVETVRVQKGAFEIVVTTTGELQAQSMERIQGPSELQNRNVRVGDVKILDLVPEGTIVREGDYVARLDPSAADTRLKDIQDELERLEAQYDRVVLDTSLNLRGIRSNIANLLFDLEEKQIAVEQSIYEPPATQRQVQNNLERAQRAYEQEVRNYKLKEEQAAAQVKDEEIKLSRKQREYEEMTDVLSRFTIYAPKPGMVIYHKEWGGEKRKVGSQISAWDLTVATLPDLSIMQSKTYVNEIDISKIKRGQPVRVGVDAFPEKSYTGQIIEVSNIGEQLKNADAKVFEVTLRLNESDPILRPAMTSSNQIITATFKDVLYVPLEALFGDDSLSSYVYRTNGTKQIVVPGEMNENFRIIEQGLEEDDELYLSLPENPERFKLTGQELIPVLQERSRLKAEEEQRIKDEAERAAQDPRGGMPGFRRPGGGNRPQGEGNRSQGEGNRIQGEGDRPQGGGNRLQGEGNRPQGGGEVSQGSGEVQQGGGQRNGNEGRTRVVPQSTPSRTQN